MARIAEISAVFAGLALLASASAWGQQGPNDSERIGRMIRDASRALQGGNAASFLGYFDKDEFADFASLRESVVALTGQRQIASSVGITELDRLERGYRVRIIWLLQLSYTGDPGPIETRRELVTCTVTKQSSSWKIVELDPVSLFRP